jgi:hypothetical protein
MNSSIGEPYTGRNRPCCDVCAMSHAAASTHMFCYWLLFLCQPATMCPLLCPAVLKSCRGLL